MEKDLGNIFLNFNDKQQQELKYLGYTVLGKIGSDALASLKEETTQLISETQTKYPDGELFNLINADLDTKLASNRVVEKYLNPFLEKVFDTQQVEIHAVSHIIKPFGLKSYVWHQDCAIVDEREDFSLNAWMPLVDSHRLNGCMWFFPGSHLATNFARQFGYNPIIGDTLRSLRKYMKPVKVKAGEVLVFHRNMIHGSSNNLLPMKRIAIEGIVVPKGVQFYNFHRDENLVKDKVLGYQVEMEHFLRASPKEDFYNGRYPCIVFEDEGFENIQQYLLASSTAFFNHSIQYHEAMG